MVIFGKGPGFDRGLLHLKDIIGLNTANLQLI